MRTFLPRRLLAAGLAVVVCVVGDPSGPGGGALSAQEDAARPPSIAFDAARTGLTLDFGDLLLDGGLRRALEQGLPLRIRLQAELWRDGFLDREEGSAEWGASVILDPVAREYEVSVAGQGRIARSVTLVEVTEVLEEAFALRLRPGREARYYYLAELEVETLSLSDLDELRRWLGGDVAAAVRGEGDVENAIASGVRRIFVRALGLPARRERLRTPSFEWRMDLTPPDPAGSDPAARR